MVHRMNRPDWIAVDWGTTHLRACAMGASGIAAEATSDDGMGRLTREAFEPALLRLIAPWLGPAASARWSACGMVGSRQGWHEAPYRAVPCPPLDPGAGAGARHGPTHHHADRARAEPDQPPDVMRGEETQIAGALALHPASTACICLPGTHSKWAHSGGRGGQAFRPS